MFETYGKDAAEPFSRCMLHRRPVGAGERVEKDMRSIGVKSWNPRAGNRNE